MKVLTLLPVDAFARLAAAAGGPAALVRANNDTHLREFLVAMSHSLVVVDPKLIGPGQITDTISAFVNTGARVIVYTSLTPEGIQAALPFVRANASEVILRGYDDGLTRLQHLLTTEMRLAVVGRLLELLEPAMRAMPPILRSRVHAMFHDDNDINSAKRLALAASMTRRSLARCMSHSGLISVRLLVAAPKVIRAYMYLRQPGTSVARAAALLGFSSSRPLEHYCQALLGTSASELRDALTADQIIARIANRLLANTIHPLSRQ